MYLYKVFTGHLNMECFESAVPAIFLSYAPTFFKYNSFSIHRGFNRNFCNIALRALMQFSVLFWYTTLCRSAASNFQTKKHFVNKQAHSNSRSSKEKEIILNCFCLENLKIKYILYIFYRSFRFNCGTAIFRGGGANSIHKKNDFYLFYDLFDKKIRQNVLFCSL